MDIFDLIDQLADAERRLRQAHFVAPCVPGGGVCTRIEGLVRTFDPAPEDFEGWGIFAADAVRARLVEEASPGDIERYLGLFSTLRLVLVEPLDGRSWLAFPANRSDMAQRFSEVRPVVVHLVERARAFETIVARTDGSNFWFERIDRVADPALAERLRAAKDETAHPAALTLAGLTPEMREAYALTWGPDTPEPTRYDAAHLDAEELLAQALASGGGRLCDFGDGGVFWNVRWETGDGETHQSAVDKEDLTVISAGICLSGRDRDFDLQSLVGVVEDRWRI
ncbi:MAG: hypothetical protein ACOCV2_03985 [Persicimonas sp.]